MARLSDEFWFITGTGNVPRQERYPACSKTQLDASERGVPRILGQNSARSQVKTQVKLGLLKMGSRWDQGSGAWAPPALGPSPTM